MGLVDRILYHPNLAGEPDPLGKIGAFVTFLYVHLVAWFLLTTLSLAKDATMGGKLLMLSFPIAMFACLAGHLSGRSPRTVALCASAIQIGFFALGEPLLMPNHVFLALILTLAVAGLGHLPQDRLLLLALIRWITVIVFFYTGFQKLWYGTYLDGHFFAQRAASLPEFRSAFELFLPAEEMQRLLAYGTEPGAGPFRLESWSGLVLSNSVWITEMLLPVLLLLRPTRRYALWVSVVFLFGTEIVAREVVFGVLFLNLMLLFSEKNLIRPILPFVAGFYLLLVLGQLGVFPIFFFST